MLGLIRKIIQGVKKTKTKKIKAGYLVIDLREEGIWVKDKFIPQKNIIAIDPDKKVIIYKTDDGRIEEIPYISNNK